MRKEKNVVLTAFIHSTHLRMQDTQLWCWLNTISMLRWKNYSTCMAR